MTTFIKDDFLLENEISKKLYSYAKKMPIIDYHCHLSPQEIYEDKKFENITELWLGGDHYKWRLMRSFGVEEKYITGDASAKDKFFAWAKTLSLAIGNPLYEWSHLELKNYFGYDGVLDENTAENVWNLCNEKLKDLSARKLIKNSNVTALCTTDDPLDYLNYHKMMQKEDLGFKVYPAFRPDKALYIEKDNWNEYLDKLSYVVGYKIESYQELLKALVDRIDYFENVGCSVSDHGLSYVPYEDFDDEKIEEIFKARRDNKVLSIKEYDQFKTALLSDLMKQYHDRNWVCQLHYGVKRDNSTFLLNNKGNDVGGDSIGDSGNVDNLANFLDLLDKQDKLPKTIIYSLNPNDNTAIDTIMACFQKGPVKSKLQHGSAWWFNDNYDGMMDQLHSLATQGYLAGFVGMLTDSRSFLSYARHEYFRRVLCSFLGELVSKGRYPEDYDKLQKIVEDICYNNTKQYFGF